MGSSLAPLYPTVLHANTNYQGSQTVIFLQGAYKRSYILGAKFTVRRKSHFCIVCVEHSQCSGGLDCLCHFLGANFSELIMSYLMQGAYICPMRIFQCCSAARALFAGRSQAIFYYRLYLVPLVSYLVLEKFPVRLQIPMCLALHSSTIKVPRERERRALALLIAAAIGLISTHSIIFPLEGVCTTCSRSIKLFFSTLFAIASPLSDLTKLYSREMYMACRRFHRCALVLLAGCALFRASCTSWLDSRKNQTVAFSLLLQAVDLSLLFLAKQFTQAVESESS
eukprot:TRINITY_DN6394_c0_g3_i1.p1 TRINITY_DN6394_c0_g3~~TRINITY_DN6394_c0_g3_i1.p1  ORF type:complete len:282 (-),score=-47.81 TRINITY_DN6394_c0_g3_i1:403-1248(-)